MDTSFFFLMLALDWLLGSPFCFLMLVLDWLLGIPFCFSDVKLRLVVWVSKSVNAKEYFRNIGRIFI